MTPEQFLQKMLNGRNEIQKLVQTKLPRMIGKTAVDHFKENFRKGGFVDGGLQKWTEPKRYDAEGKYAASKYGTLLSARKELYNSIAYVTSNGQVIIKSDKEYAQIHNEGGNINHPGGTYYFYSFKKKKSIFVKNVVAARFLKPLPKTKAHIIPMPKRQFIGKSKELDIKITEIIETELSLVFSP